MRTRLVPYTPFGAKRAPLPDALEAQLVTPMGELPTSSVHYHRQGVNAVVLDGVTELAYEYWNGASWVEPPNARFLSMTGNFDHLEETPTRNYSFVGIGWMLRRAKVWEPNGLPVDADGKVQFLSANAGTIMATLIQNAKGRGWGAGVQIDFSSTTDSSGQSWAKVLTIAYDLELDLEAVLSNLYQQGVCDYRWEGRTLRIFNPETTMARDRTTGTGQVRLVVADGQSSAPEDWTNEDLVTDALVLGDEGKSWTFANNASQPLGRLETVITQGGVSDPGTASLLADQDLLKGSATRISYTREFTVTAGSRVRPFQDYQVGDWVWAQRGTKFERLRVMSLSLTVAPEGLRGHAVLGDRLEDLLTKLAKRTKGITGGASAGGNGTRPAPEGPDTRIPSTPSGLVIGVDSYIDDTGWPAGRVDVDWAHDGTATNGTAMTIDRFQVFYRINEVGRPWAQLITTSDTEAAYSPLPVFKADGVTPEQYGFKVRAVGENGKVSAWTPVVAVTMEDDLTPPPVPEFLASHLTTWLRTITVRVSGKGAAGETMPRDFSHFNAYQGASASGPWVLTGTKHGAEPGLVYQSQSMPANATVWFYLTAVDRSGNESASSAIQSVTPAANVDLSELTERIDAGQVLIENSDQILLDTGMTLGEKLSSNDGLIDEALRGLPEISLSAPTLADGVDRPVGALWQQINAAGAQIGFFRWDGAAWVSMPLDPVVVPVIQIGSGTAGQMDISRLTASAAELETVVTDKLWVDVVRSRKFTTDMMVVGQGSNSIADPFFMDADLTAARIERNGGLWSRGSYSGNSDAWMEYTGTGIAEFRFFTAYMSTATMNEFLPVKQDQVWRFSTFVRANNGSGARWLVQALHLDGTTTYALTDPSTYSTGGTVRHRVEATYTVPSGVVAISPFVSFSSSVTEAQVFVGAFAGLMSDASLIVNGGVVARHITASEEMWTKVLGAHKILVGEIDSNSFTSDAGFVGDMRTGILTSNVVKTEHLDALAITAKHKITSALYQTTATANRGIKIDADYFRAWNASGNETFRIDASTGDVTANGAVITGSKFQTALVDTGNQWGDKRWMELNEKGLFFYTGQPGFSPAAKFYVNTETNTMEFIGGAFTAGTIYGADIRSELNGSGSGGVIMQPGGLYGYDSTGQRMFTMASANGFVFADKRFGVGTIGGERIIINSSNDGGRMGVWFSDTGDGSIGGSNTGGIYIEPNGGELNLRGQDGLGVVAWQGLTVNSGLISNARFRALDTPSTSLAANAHISVGGSAPGTLYLSSSASRFKLDQQILDLPDELLDVPMKDWIDKAEYDDRERLLALGVRDKYQQTVIDTPLRRVPGMVAEDVETTPGGEAFVTRDAEGQTLGLSYERLANARTAVLKRQLDELALRVQALETAA